MSLSKLAFYLVLAILAYQSLQLFAAVLDASTTVAYGVPVAY